MEDLPEIAIQETKTDKESETWEVGTEVNLNSEFAVDGRGVMQIKNHPDGKKYYSLEFRLDSQTFEELSINPVFVNMGPGVFQYDSPNGRTIDISECKQMENSNLKMSISTGKLNGADFRGVAGLVRIESEAGVDVIRNAFPEIFSDKPTTKDRVETYNQHFYPNGTQSEKPSIFSRFLSKDSTTESISDISEVRQTRVNESYSTYEIPGQNEKYRREKGLYRLETGVNSLDVNTVVGIVNHDGLTSSLERLRRGILPATTELLHPADIQTGGGDYVFCHFETTGMDNRKRSNAEGYKYGRYGIELDLTQLDRLDWFGYPSEQSGSRDPKILEKHALPPAKLFDVVTNKFIHNGGLTDFHELMIKNSIPPEAIRRINARDYDAKTEILQKLTSLGMNDVNGVPIDRFVVCDPPDNFNMKVVGKAESGTNNVLMYEYQGKDKDIGGVYYGKSYEDGNGYTGEDKARNEYFAYLMYKQMGVKVPDMQLVVLNGKYTILSKKIENNITFSPDDVLLDQNKDIGSGFITDAFLGNWDVLGGNFENLLKTEKGDVYRIDYGGATLFKGAERALKDLQPTVVELQTMRDKDRYSGMYFSRLVEDKTLGEQVQILKSRVTPGVIKSLLDESGLYGPIREKIEDILNKRLNSL